MVLEDWGYEYLYLRHQNASTRVSPKDHTYRDVTQKPLEEFESATSDFTPRTNTDATCVKDAWIFQVPSQDKLEEDKKQMG